MAYEIRDNYETGLDSWNAQCKSNYFQGQTFKASGTYVCSKVEFLLYRHASNAPGDVTCYLFAVDGSNYPTGSALLSDTIDGDAITTDTDGEWTEFDFGDGAVITNDTTYAIYLKTSTTNESLYIRGDGSSPTYTDGRAIRNGNPTWYENTELDDAFRVYATIGEPTDKTYSKALVAIGNHEVWYESSAGTMSELAAANGEINTSTLLNATEAFQKLFIANTTNLKVVDFINTKIATTDLNTHAPDPGTILTGGTSTAEMVVDYITSITADAACTIYGKRTTTATFSSGETVTGTDDDGNTVTFATSAAETAPPHWYDWTVFGADSTFGTMPDSAYLVCRYRGRIVLSGNPSYPHQWYMSKIVSPFDFLYGTNNPMTAVAGTNADAGELGDIVRALIPFGDDFLIFGCANSIHLLDGDPASGGSIDELDDKTGIFGPWAWCKDGVGNLWFYGTGGLYKMAGGRSKPINISQSHLPQLVSNWGAVPGTHRVVLTYDPFRNGIIISRTTLVDGTNLNYYYDFKTEGFYPETYPTACGIFSSHYYDSDAVATKGLVLGCNDGYIRNFYDADKDDDSGGSNTAISSYVAWPIEHLTEDNDKEGKLTSLTIELAGGGAGGDFGDTDGVSYKLYVGDDAETVLEKMKAEDDWATGTVYAVGALVIYDSVEYRCITAHTSDSSGPPFEEPDTNTTDWLATVFASGTLSGTGRKNRIRTKVRGAWLGLKFYNSADSETWSINRVFGEVKEVGRIK